MLSGIGAWFLEIISLPERRKYLQEAANRLANYYHDFAIRNKDVPNALDEEFKDVMYAAEILLKQKKWDQLIGMAEVLSSFMEERGYWNESLWLHSAALDGVERRLVRLFQQSEAPDWGRKISFLTRLGNISVQQGYFQDGEKYLVAALQTAERIKNKKIQAQINNILGALSRLQGHPGRAQEYLDQGVSRHPEVGAQISGGYLQLLSEGNFDGAKQELLTWRDAARRNNDRVLEAEALCNLGVLAIREGNRQEALTAYQQAIAIYAENQKLDEEQNAWHGLAKALGTFGGFDEAHRILDQVIDYFTRKGSNAAILDTLIDKGGFYAEAKDFEKAEMCFHQGMDIAIELQSLPQLAICFYNMGNIYEGKNDLERAIQAYRQFLGAADESQHQKMIEIACYCLASALFQNGNLEEARQHLSRRLEISRSLGLKWEEASTLYLLGQVDSKLESFTSSESFLEQAVALYGDIGNPVYVGRVLYSLSDLLFEQHQFNRSWEQLLQMLPLIDASNRETLLPLALTMLDGFAGLPEYQEQAVQLRNALIVNEGDVAQ